MSTQTIDLPVTSVVACLYARAEAIDLAAVVPTTLERRAPRKEQAAATRQLFKSLGLRGISVTAPNYSMAQSVDVRIPSLDDSAHDVTKWPHGNSNDRSESTRCPACASRSKARRKIEAILAKAFPNHSDRSDSQSDHFDYCWSID